MCTQYKTRDRNGCSQLVQPDFIFTHKHIMDNSIPSLMLIATWTTITAIGNKIGNTKPMVKLTTLQSVSVTFIVP